MIYKFMKIFRFTYEILTILAVIFEIFQFALKLLKIFSIVITSYFFDDVNHFENNNIKQHIVINNNKIQHTIFV